MLPPAIQRYLLITLEQNPSVISKLLSSAPSHGQVWDNRPYSDRFTLREIIAHLADWDPIFLNRLYRIVNEAYPELPNIDEGQMVIDHDYATQDPHHNIDRFVEGRERLVKYVRTLPVDAWDRRAKSGFVGDLSLADLLELIVVHDGYHAGQIVEWLQTVAS